MPVTPAGRSRFAVQRRAGIAALVGGLTVIAGGATAAARVPAPIELVGWWLNPTPNNVWLRVGPTEYVVSEQGSVSADGDWPEFAAARFVRTNGGYGYGCATLRVVADGERILRIVSAASLPLRRCRASAAYRKAEPSIK